MKTIQVEETGGPEVLKMVDVAGLEPPGPGQAVVRIVAAGVNFLDVNQRRGIYPRQLPFTPGLEAAGVVESIGEGIHHVEPSSRVTYVDQPGAYAEASLVCVERLIPLPDDISFEEGAAFPLQGITAHYLIHEFRKPKQGDVVLIHAAAGGVGLLLVQWASHLGARVIGTVSTEEKSIAAREAGAEAAILYTKEDFAAAVKEMTNGRGADLILDGVGKSTFRGDLEAAAIRGHIVVFGVASGPAEPISPNALMAKALTVSGGAMARFIATREEMMRRANDVIRGVREGWLKLKIDRLPLDKTDEAHRLLEGRKTSGKIVLTQTDEQIECDHVCAVGSIDSISIVCDPLVIRSGDFYPFAGERRRFFLVIQLINLLCVGLVQHERAVLSAFQRAVLASFALSFFIFASCEPTVAHLLSIMSPMMLAVRGGPACTPVIQPGICWNPITRINATKAMDPTFFISLLLAGRLLSSNMAQRVELQNP